MSEPTTPSLVNYDVTEQDVAAFQGWARRTDARAWLQHLFIAGIVLPGIVLMGALVNDWRLMLVVVGVLAILVPLEQRKKMRQIWRDSGVVGWHSLELDDTGLVFRSTNGAARLDWRQIQGIVRLPQGAYFLMGPITAIVLPLRAFPEPAAADRFLREAESRREAALAVPLTPVAPLVLAPGELGVEYALHEQDVRALQLYPLRQATGLFVVVGVLVLAAAFLAAYRWGLLWSLTLLAAEGAIVATVGLAFSQDHQRLMADPVTTSPRSLAISPLGLAGRGAGAEEGQVAWTQVKKVAGTRDHLVVQWKQESVIGIPRRCFSSGADAEAFLTRAREWHAAAQPPPLGRAKLP